MTVSRRLPRTDRLELLARTLGDRPGISAATLAEEFGLSERTVFRDLESLRDRGYPIEGERGRGGGLRLHPNWGLGRVLLSREEGLAALLSLALAEQLGFPLLGDGLRQARRRLLDAFPAGERRRMRPLRDRIVIGPPASPSVAASYASPSGTALRTLQQAFLAEQVVTADYTAENGRTLRRTFEPHVLAINWPVWYLLVHDGLRNAPRTFRIDRLANIVAGRAHFRAHPAPLVQALLRDSGHSFRAL
ncbi:MAG: helix-turn-helix transcriptional regulator [Gemmatimonas sp.]|uniref:helix-turn-helix transcriptional regulator n=2 Tax=Gemmatimonas sp. TaxID=1962908 RepID=UPI00391BB7BB